MSAYYLVFLLAFLVLFAVLLVRYVDCAVEGEFRTLARAAEDEPFRLREIERLDGLLAGRLPLPAEVRPMPEPSGGWRRAPAAVLLAAGTILLWGAGAAPADDRSLWLAGGCIALLVAGCGMLFGLSRRRTASCARLLLLRANLRRLQGDREGAAGDLEEMLRLAPWDDAAWSELADDRAVAGRPEAALEAMEKALALDPRYEDYHMGAASLALRAGRLGRMEELLASWRALGGDGDGDPRIAVYRAALELARGGREQALDALTGADDVGDVAELEEDAALGGVRDILPEAVLRRRTKSGRRPSRGGNPHG